MIPPAQGLNPNHDSLAFTLSDASPATRRYRVRPDDTLSWQKGLTSTFSIAGVALAGGGRILLGGDHVLFAWMPKVDLDGMLLWPKTYDPHVSGVRSFTRPPAGTSVPFARERQTTPSATWSSAPLRPLRRPLRSRWRAMART